MKKLRYLSLLLCIGLSLSAQGQSPAPAAPAPAALPDQVSAAHLQAILEASIGKTLRVRTSVGGDFRGELYSVGQDRIELLDSDGRIVPIARSLILSAVAEEKVGGYFQDAAENRLIVMPTAFGMEKGEFHVTNQEILAFTSSLGFGDRFTLWGGVSIPGALVNLKLSQPLGTFGAAALGCFGGYAWIGESAVALPYALLSLGNRERHLDLGGGAIWTLTSQGATSWSAVWALAAKLPISRTTALVGESWFVLGPEYPGAPDTLFTAWPMFAFRIASSRYSWDLGALMPLSYYSNQGSLTFFMGSTTFIPIPILSFTYRVN